jgi:hypothetical protein
MLKTIFALIGLVVIAKLIYGYYREPLDAQRNKEEQD